MKRNNKPLSSAERAKQLGISQEQFEEQARKEVDKFFRKQDEANERKQSLSVPKFNPGPPSFAEDARMAKVQRKWNAHQREIRDQDHDWPPFPLPDKYKDNDPYLIGDAIYQLSRIRRHWEYIPKEEKVEFKGEQLKHAIQIAWDVRSAWLGEELELPEVPLAKNLNLPVEQDFFELEQWFRNASVLVQGEIARNTAEARLASADKGKRKKLQRVKLNEKQSRVSIGQKWYDLTPNQYNMLSALFAAKGAWVAGKTIGTEPHKIRKAMPKAVAHIIETHKTQGYRINPDLLA